MLQPPGGNGGVASEVVWNNGAATSASGGGVSAFFQVRRSQSGAGINPVSANPPNNPGRGPPDVCAQLDSLEGCRPAQHRQGW